MKIVITDLTKFGNEDMFCTAGISLNTGKCVRPMPYLKSNICRKLNILPGGIFSGRFSKTPDCSPPHSEDMNYTDLKFHGQCPSKDFETILLENAVSSIEKGFGVTLDDRQKHIPLEMSPAISIITLKVSPYQIKLLENSYKPGRILINFTDSDSRDFNFMPITDLGYCNFAERNASSLNESLYKLNNFINKQNIAFLRVGLTRPYRSQDGRNGYWIQVNGIYTFPDCFKDIRCYI